MNAVVVITALLLGTALQARLPAIGWLGGLRLEFLPALVAYGALTLRRGGALALALAAGFLQDSLSAGPFGLTALVYVTVTASLTGLHEAFERELMPVQIGAGAALTAVGGFASAIACGFPAEALWKIAALAGLSLIITPVMFFVLEIAHWRGRTE